MMCSSEAGMAGWSRLTDTPKVQQVVNRAFADLGRIGVVVSNAGYGLFGAAEEMTDEQILHKINTNLVGWISSGDATP